MHKVVLTSLRKVYSVNPQHSAVQRSFTVVQLGRPPTVDLLQRVGAALGFGGQFVYDRFQLGVHLGRFAVELLLAREQRLQVRHQEQYSRIVQGRQFVVQLGIQHLVCALCFLQLFTASRNLERQQTQHVI